MKHALTLQTWLDTAAKGFFPETQTRIRAEYTAAYHDALEAGETDVLHAWGDPRRVNRELRRTYLTVEDTALFQRVDVPLPKRKQRRKANPQRRKTEDSICLLMLIGMFAWISYSNFGESPFTPVLFAAMLLPLFALTRMKLNEPLKPQPNYPLMLGKMWRWTLALALWPLMLSLLPWPNLDPGARWASLLLTVLLLGTALDTRHKWLKARMTFKVE